MVSATPVRLWLLPNAVLLAALAIWGVLRYSHLPERIPKQIGVGGVDAWTDRSIGSAFVLVFVYAGVTVLTVGSVELVLRVTPQDELLSADAAPFAAAGATSLNRPASRASARRIARALWLLNLCFGISFLVGCGMLWRSMPDPEVPSWLFVAMTLPIVVGTALMVAAVVRDRKQ